MWNFQKNSNVLLKNYRQGKPRESGHFEVCACCNMLFTEMKYSGNHISYPPV